MDDNCRKNAAKMQKIIDIRKHFTTYSVFLRKIIPLIPILQGKNIPLIPLFCLYKGLHAFLISANLFHASRRGVWFRVLCGELHKHNRDRAEDSLSDKGMICYYVDRAYYLSLLFLN